MLRPLAAALMLFASPCLADEAPTDTVTVDSYAGPVTLARSPEKIAVLDVAALDTLDALDVPVAATVDKVFVPYLADLRAEVQPVGSLFEPDFEALAAGQFDLIVAGGRSAKHVTQLAEIAPTIDMTIWEDTIAQGLARLEAYGHIFGKEAEAEALRDQFEAQLQAARAAVEGQGRALIVMTNGPKVSAYGAAGRFGWLHRALDLPEAVAAVEQATHGEAISFEFIRDADPDILIVLDRLSAIGKPGVQARATLDNPLVRATKAWKHDRVIYLTSDQIYIAGGGIQSLTATLGELTAAFTDVSGS